MKTQASSGRVALLVLAALAAALSGGCDANRGAPDPDGDDERADIVITHFTERTELFVEFPQLVVGERSPFAAHVTDLVDFRPLLAGEVTAVLAPQGAPPQRFSVDAPRRAGLFVPEVVPTEAGLHELAIEVRTPAFSVVHELGTVMVFPDIEAALLAPPEADDEGITFLKEQQWVTDFATGLAGTRPLRRGLPAAGFLRPAANAESRISAPAAGTVLRAGRPWPAVGDTVRSGERLAMIAPRLAGASDVLSLELERDRAVADHALAEQQLERLQGLFERQAVPERSVLEARATLARARAELDAAQRRLDLLLRETGEDAGGIALIAPIDGELIEVQPAAGAYVEEGASLFRIVDTSRLWLEAHVAEADIVRLGQPSAAVFRVTGSPHEVDIQPGRNGRLISAGRVVDPATRTVPVIFELENGGEHALPIGAYARVRLLTGETVTELAVPESAVVDDGGQTVVFVQLGGESFERRVVQLGIRDAGFAEIVAGLDAGERIVTRGAWLVRLAAASPSEAGAGHTH